MLEKRMYRFVSESNAIEGIERAPTAKEIAAHHNFLASPPSVQTLERFVSVVQPNAVLRRRPGLNVRVGSHIAPPGGPAIESRLEEILNIKGLTPFERHAAYENLHPFTDGNGRSGRALWLYDMGGIAEARLDFLHHWYYQSLSALSNAAVFNFLLTRRHTEKEAQ